MTAPIETATPMLAAALELAAAGWRPFPCRESGPNAKAPYTEHGHLDASREPEALRAWWARWPDAMIGAAVPDSLVVLDIDPRNGGSLEALEALVGPLPETLTCWSGRNDGGRHLYFMRPAGLLTSTRLPVGVDLKAAGYCIVPPSVHPATGRPYRWELHDPVPVPARLRGLLRPAPQSPPRAALRGTPPGADATLVRLAGSVREGERNKALFWAACRAAERGTLDSIQPDLLLAATTAGLPEPEALRTIASARRTAGGVR